MEKEFRALQPDEVISIMPATSQKFFKELQTFTPQESAIALRDFITEKNQSTYYSGWFTEGVSCKVVTSGEKWRTGKVKIGLIFCPDEVETEQPISEPESTETENRGESETKEEEIIYPLDEIRRSLNSSNELS